MSLCYTFKIAALTGLFLTFMQIGTSAQNFYPVHWTNPSANLDVVECTSSIGYIGSTQAGYVAGARSIESFPASGNGIVRVRIGSSTSRSVFRAISLSTVDANYSLNEMDFALMITASNLYVFAKGVVLTQTATTANYISIEKIGAEIRFYVGNVLLHTTRANPSNSLPYFVDTSFRGSGQWEGIEVNFPSVHPVALLSLNGGVLDLGSNKIVKSGTAEVRFVSENAVRSNYLGSVVYVNDTSAKQAKSWSFGFAKSAEPLSSMQWNVTVKIDADCKSFDYFVDGLFLFSGSIAHGSRIQLRLVGDRTYLLVNDVQLSERIVYYQGPQVFQIYMATGFGDPIPLNNFSMDIPSTETAFVSAPDISAGPVNLSVSVIGIHDTDVEYCWSDTYISRSAWPNQVATLSADVAALLNDISYDQVFKTESTSVQFAEATASKLFVVDKSDGSFAEVNYNVDYKCEVAQINGYTFNNNVLVRTGTSNPRFELGNGTLVGTTNGEVEFQPIDARGASQVFGLMKNGAAFNSIGQHITNGFQINTSGFIGIILNGQATSLGHTMPGDKFRIVVNGLTISFYRNNRLVQSGALVSGDAWRIAAHYNSGTATSQLKVRTTFDHLAKPKRYAPRVTHAKCNGTVLGSINGATVAMPGQTITYTLTKVGSSLNSQNTTGAYNNLSVGSYTLVTSNGLNSNIDIGYFAEFETIAGNCLTYQNESSTIIKSISEVGISQAMAINRKILPSSGWIEWDQFQFGNKAIQVVFSSDPLSRITEIYVSPIVYRGIGNFCSTVAVATNLNGFCRYRIAWNNGSFTLYSGGLPISSTNPLTCNVDNFSGLFDIIASIAGDVGLRIFNMRASFCTAEVQDFADLKLKLDNGYLITDGEKLRFRYIEQYHDDDGYLEYEIFDEGRNSVMTSTNDLAIRYGTNYLNLDVTQLNEGKYYILEVRNSKDEVLKLRFKR